MHQPERVIFTNMVMVCDGQGNVLVLRRRDPAWPGIAFPGGHVEPGETFARAAIREVYEETGIMVSGLRLCGVKHWEDDGVRSVVLLYRADHQEGTVRSSEEGEVWWMPLEEFPQSDLAEGMADTLRVFTDERISEHTFRQENGRWTDVME